MKTAFKIVLIAAALTMTFSTYADEARAAYVCESGDAVVLLPIPTKEEHDSKEVNVQMSGVTTAATYVRDGLSQFWSFNKEGTTYIVLTPDLTAKYFHNDRIAAHFRCELR